MSKNPKFDEKQPYKCKKCSKTIIWSKKEYKKLIINIQCPFCLQNNKKSKMYPVKKEKKVKNGKRHGKYK